MVPKEKPEKCFALTEDQKGTFLLYFLNVIVCKKKIQCLGYTLSCTNVLKIYNKSMVKKEE